jgi:archaellum component FlaG (FlaF/FlaG flagellin family)
VSGIDEFSTESPGTRHEPPPAPSNPDELGLVPSAAQPPAPAASNLPPARGDLTPVELGAPSALASASGAATRRWVVLALAALVVVQAPFLAYWGLRSAGVLGSATGTLAIETDPAGLEVIVDGSAAGRTPVELTLAEGTRSVVLKQGPLSRTVAVNVRRGETVRHRFEFVAAAAPAAASSGTLQVTSDPPRVPIVVDGVARGVTPITLPDLAAGTHALAVRFSTATVEQRVEITQGATRSLHIVAPSTSASVAGWLSVDVASPLQIFEEDKLVGTTNIGRLLLPPGVHVLDFVSDELGFRAQRTVTVKPGAPTDVRLELPSVTLSVNAQPWAEVFVDGERVGETPIGTLARPVGRHEIVLRHPDLGERRRTVTLTTNGPNRISVDMRRP